MSLLELTLENPAYKRVTDSDSADDREAASTDAAGSRRRPALGIAVVAVAVATVAIRRRRS